MNTCDSFERFSDTGVFHKPVGDYSTNSARSVINEVAEANAEECQYREPGRNDSFSVRLGRNDRVRSVLNDREKGRRRGSGAYPYAPAERPAVRPGITTWLPVPEPGITTWLPVPKPSITISLPVPEPGITTWLPVPEPGITTWPPTWLPTWSHESYNYQNTSTASTVACIQIDLLRRNYSPRHKRITQLIHHRHFTKSACRQNAARTFSKTLLVCVMIQINGESENRMRPSPLR